MDAPATECASAKKLKLDLEHGQGDFSPSGDRLDCFLLI